MKYYRIIIIIAVFLLGAFIFRGTFSKNFSQIPPSPVQAPQVVVTVIIDTGVSQKTYANIPASTPYGALFEASKQDNFEIKSKQYDFGVFVEGIGEFENTNEKSWIYEVNGISGDVAADKKDLVMGDTVLWKYVTPTKME